MLVLKIGIENNERMVGVGFVDVMMRKMLVVEFVDND